MHQVTLQGVLDRFGKDMFERAWAGSVWQGDFAALRWDVRDGDTGQVELRATFRHGPHWTFRIKRLGERMAGTFYAHSDPAPTRSTDITS